MSTLLIILVVLLVAIAIWQLTRILDLANIIGNDDPSIASEKDNNRNGFLMLAFGVFVYVSVFGSMYLWWDVLLPKSASEHGLEYDFLMEISFVIIFIVLVLTQFLLHFFAFKYRGINNRKALFFADSMKLEAIWTIIPVIVLSVIIIYGLVYWNDIMTVNEEDNAIEIELYAKQFGWQARYGGKDNTLGKANVRFIEGTNTMGVDPSDPHSKDDIIPTEIYLPLGKQVLFKMRSQDVLHSAYMPHFRAQMNCVPGMITQFTFKPTVTTEEMRKDPSIIARVKKINNIREENSKELVAKGEEALAPYEFDYLLLCNKICGSSHYNMQMKIVVVTPEEYEVWLKQQNLFTKR